MMIWVKAVFSLFLLFVLYSLWQRFNLFWIAVGATPTLMAIICGFSIHSNEDFMEKEGSGKTLSFMERFAGFILSLISLVCSCFFFCTVIPKFIRMSCEMSWLAKILFGITCVMIGLVIGVGTLFMAWGATAYFLKGLGVRDAILVFFTIFSLVLFVCSALISSDVLWIVTFFVLGIFLFLNDGYHDEMDKRDEIELHESVFMSILSLIFLVIFLISVYFVHTSQIGIGLRMICGIFACLVVMCSLEIVGFCLKRLFRYLGNWVDRREMEKTERRREKAEQHEEAERKRREEEERRRKKVEETKRFLVSLFSMAAKMAKADGVADASEVRMAEQLFTLLNIQGPQREKLKNAFNAALLHPEGIYADADTVAAYVGQLEARAFFYELLWEIACADGVLASEEKEILIRICPHLKIPDFYFELNYLRRVSTFQEAHRHSQQTDEGSHVDGTASLADAYATLGCHPEATDEEVRRAYRTSAKTYHPDVLRANNVPDEMIAVATRKMAALNEAWARIRRARGL